MTIQLDVKLGFHIIPDDQFADWIGTDVKFESQTREEVVKYELLRKNGIWKVDGPVPAAVALDISLPPPSAASAGVPVSH
jgi:hypothetical protein